MRFLLSIVIGVVLGGCHAAPEPPESELGPRLVVLSPALAVILRDVGAGKLIVGRHDFDQVFTDLPACGHQGGIDYERILELHPTHVLIEWGSRPLPDRLVTMAGTNGWTIERFELRTLADIVGAAETLQGEFGSDPDASRIGAMLEQAWAPSSVSLKPVGRVLMLGALSPPGALGPGSFHAQILERIGATPAFTNGSPWIELDAEDVLDLAPDAIILIQPRKDGDGIAATGASAIDLLGVMGTLDIPAVRTGQVAVFDGVSDLTPSTGMADFAIRLKQVLESWAQPD